MLYSRVGIVDLLIDGKVPCIVAGSVCEHDFLTADSLKYFKLEFIFLRYNLVFFFAKHTENSVDQSVWLLGYGEACSDFVGQVLYLEDSFEVQNGLAFK